MRALLWKLRNSKRAKFAVSTKIALYSSDFSQVLLIRYAFKNYYGLPGGHIDKGEKPEEALRRELQEELGIEVGEVSPRHFFFKKGDHGSLVLAFVGTVERDIQLNPPHPQFEMGAWMTKEQFGTIENMSQYYKLFVLEQWPV